MKMNSDDINSPNIPAAGEINVDDSNHLGTYTTNRSLLNKLKLKLQEEQEKHSDWPSTTQLDKDLKSLEDEYLLIPESVSKYDYVKIQHSLNEYKSDEDNLKNLTNEEKFEPIRTKIDKLRDEYSKAEKGKKDEYLKAWDELYKIKTYSEKAMLDLTNIPPNGDQTKKPPASKTPPDPAVELIEEKKKLGAKEIFYNHKNLSNKVTSVFSVLDSLKTDINKIDSKNIKKKYAYYLEFKEVLDDIRWLSSDDAEQQKGKSGKPHPKEPPKNDEWLKSQLMEKFKDWAYKVYESFYWSKDSIAKDKAAGKAWMKYEEFLKTRKMQFISEAEEVEPSTTTDGCE